jgi:hypothetical protein
MGNPSLDGEIKKLIGGVLIGAGIPSGWKNKRKGLQGGVDPNKFRNILDM